MSKWRLLGMAVLFVAGAISGFLASIPSSDAHVQTFGPQDHRDDDHSDIYPYR